MRRIARAARHLANARIIALVLGGIALLAAVVPTGFGAQQAVPANTAQPAITGTPVQGQTLTGNRRYMEQLPNVVAPPIAAQSDASAAPPDAGQRIH